MITNGKNNLENNLFKIFSNIIIAGTWLKKIASSYKAATDREYTMIGKSKKRFTVLILYSGNVDPHFNTYNSID